jgi:hypothetical protein
MQDLTDMIIALDHHAWVVSAWMRKHFIFTGWRRMAGAVTDGGPYYSPRA